jgi:hypothetical protein
MDLAKLDVLAKILLCEMVMRTKIHRIYAAWLASILLTSYGVEYSFFFGVQNDFRYCQNLSLWFVLCGICSGRTGVLFCVQYALEG